MTTAALAAALLGAAWGSFLGVVVDRVPRGGSVRTPRSSCPACGRTLAVADLVPVLSWAVLRGRCRTCRAAIPVRSTLLELASAAVALAAGSALPLATAVPIALLLSTLAALAAIDLEHRRLPNAVVYPAAAVAVAWVGVGLVSGVGLDLRAAVVSALLFGGALWGVAVASRGGMGMGDVKVAALIGWTLGAIDGRSAAVAAAAAITVGGLVGLVALARGADRRAAVPFGPMLAAGALVGAFWGPAIADAYLAWVRR